MNRAEALDKANAIVAEWTAQAKNERGHVHDAWKPVGIEMRTKAVIELAEFLWEPDPQETERGLVPMGPSDAHLGPEIQPPASTGTNRLAPPGP